MTESREMTEKRRAEPDAFLEQINGCGKTMGAAALTMRHAILAIGELIKENDALRARLAKEEEKA